MKRFSVAATILVLILTASQSIAETLNVIVSKESSVDTISKADLKRIYLSKRNTFPNGDSAVPLDQLEQEEAFALFYQKATGKSIEQVHAYFGELFFTGRGQAPKQVPKEEIEKLVASDPTMIGYVLGDVSSDAVKVIISF